MVPLAIDFNIEPPPVWTYQREIKIVLIYIELRYRAKTCVHKRSIEDLLPIGHALGMSDSRIVSALAVWSGSQ